MNNSKEHSQLVDDLLFAVGSRPDCRLFKRNVGVAIPLHGHHPTYYGVKGEPDLQGFCKLVSYYGKVVCQAIAFEVKTGGGKLSKDQRAWRDMFISMGGWYIEARSVEQALQQLENRINNG